MENKDPQTITENEQARVSKRVRVTIEVDLSFLNLLRANIELTKSVRGWLPKGEDAADEDAADEAGNVTASQVLGLLVYMEARGGTELEIGASAPYVWRPHVDVIHAERRVYEDGKLISGPNFYAEAEKA